MDSNVVIGVAMKSPGGATAQFAEALETALGIRPKLRRLGDLAGPNETIQILLTSPEWAHFARVALDGLESTLAVATALAAWKGAKGALEKLPAVFGQFVGAVDGAIRMRGGVMFGFPEPKPYTRHCGIQIDNANPEEIARIITLLALHGEAVERFLLERDRSHPEEWHLLEHNIDMSVKIVVTQDGDMELHSGATGPNTRGPVYRLTDSVHVKNS